VPVQRYSFAFPIILHPFPVCRTACTEPQCLHSGALYLYLYLYSPYVPYGMYRASVPVQRCTLALPIPLILLCAVRPVQSLSACTTAHFTFTYTSTIPMFRTAFTELRLYNGALYLYLYFYPSSLCAVGPVQSLSACKTVHLFFTYTSTPPICRTACTEPHCLYNGAFYLYLHLYSPYVPYGLYIASVPLQRCSLPLPIHLHPYVSYGMYRASVPVERCTLPLPIPLLPQCAVRPVQNLSDFTTVYFSFTYTSNFRMCLTACTEPQCQ